MYIKAEADVDAEVLAHPVASHTISIGLNTVGVAAVLGPTASVHQRSALRSLEIIQN